MCGGSVAALRAATLEELALDRALQRLVSEFSDSTGISTELTVELPDQLQLPPALAQALYRSAHEGLTNVHRHARAKHVLVELRATSEEKLMLETLGEQCVHYQRELPRLVRFLYVQGQ